LQRIQAFVDMQKHLATKVSSSWMSSC
jgi:hypothetical protein